MKWILEFLKAYDTTESDQQYYFRKYDEKDNMLQVLKGIEKGEFKGEDFSEINLNYIENDKEFNIERTIPKIARLLKAADNITILGGRNYIEEFANIPNIDEILLEIKHSETMKKMFEKSQENIANGKIPKHKLTSAEIDKLYAQEYLRNGKRLKPINRELEYGSMIINSCNERIVDVKANTKDDIPFERKQKTSLERIIARQNGKYQVKLLK